MPVTGMAQIVTLPLELTFSSAMSAHHTVVDVDVSGGLEPSTELERGGVLDQIHGKVRDDLVVRDHVAAVREERSRVGLADALDEPELAVSTTEQPPRQVEDPVGVNVAVAQEADFNSYIQRNGFDRLIAFLRSRA